MVRFEASIPILSWIFTSVAFLSFLIVWTSLLVSRSFSLEGLPSRGAESMLPLSNHLVIIYRTVDSPTLISFAIADFFRFDLNIPMIWLRSARLSSRVFVIFKVVFFGVVG